MFPMYPLDIAIVANIARKTSSECIKTLKCKMRARFRLLIKHVVISIEQFSLNGVILIPLFYVYSWDLHYKITKEG